MGNWEVCENHQSDGSCREFEMFFVDRKTGYTHPLKRIVRLWPNGRLEVGVKESPFQCQYGENVGGECQ